MRLGEKIAKARKNINLTQDQLAESLEVTRQTISKWESDLAYPETAKISKLSEVLNVSCDYLLKDDKPVKVELSIYNSNNYAIDWAKIYPILSKYESTVDCDKYYKMFNDIAKEMILTYNYSTEDAFLVLKDLLYKAYLDMNKK